MDGQVLRRGAVLGGAASGAAAIPRRGLLPFCATYRPAGRSG